MVFRRVSLDGIDPCKHRVEVRCCDSASALTDLSLISCLTTCFSFYLQNLQICKDRHL